MRTLCLIFTLLVAGFYAKATMKDSIKVEIANHFINKTVTVYGTIYKVSFNATTKICLVKFGNPTGEKVTAIILEKNNKNDIHRLLTQEGRLIHVKGLIQKRNSQLIIDIDNVKSQIHVEEAHIYDFAPASPLPSGVTIETKDASKHIGELVNLWDTVYAYTGSRDSLTLFCIGKPYPNQLLTAVVKDPKNAFNISRFIGKRMCIRGTIIKEEDKLVLKLNDSDDVLNRL
ncbi:hypothetical protein [Mucilaginibacter polytrichastri]|uniref:DUF5666 domain-containing protein n=1 Tax=Mucilaginibacter polytrichastri TaxID=1302689 RepID=A0A1Q5ZSR9_9SPHI|nr:hypothetical protein [Mucilaginibacter polytrichastri]OKS84814.1 hypothetical protein RG47T_0249 [Mucilaginibacter polytrichastri]SFS49089.1 hypothetical protein SAMN04487890_101823 [Mucilaginibacter polytrichastri]